MNSYSLSLSRITLFQLIIDAKNTLSYFLHSFSLMDTYIVY